MKAVFIESSVFTEWVTEYLADDAYSRFQQTLMLQPDQGDVIPGCGGLRKVRLADHQRRQGKRGGTRVIYLYVPEVKWFFMLDVYGKEQKEDLSQAEKKVLSRLARELKDQAKAAVQGRTRRTK